MRRAALRIVAITCLSPAFASCRAPLVSPPSVPPADRTGLHVFLTWSASVDLDLYVTDPSWETVYFANTPSRTGGRLEQDVRCDRLRKTGPRVESVRFTAPRSGPYRAGVDFIDDCGTGVEKASFRIVVEIDGQRLEATNMVQRERFQAIAFEFEVDVPAKKIIARKTPHGGVDDATH